MDSLRKILSAIGILPLYHVTLAHFGALLYGFPSKKMLVIAVTGTKGKSSTSEMIAAILAEAGYKTALLNSIRIKSGDESKPNTMRMSMPGRMYIQRFLAKSLRHGCTAAVLEMTSEGARQYRHRGIALDALVFTNLAPEHIESHGSYEAYADAKFSIGRALAKSSKRPRAIVANADDAQSARYLALPVEMSFGFSLKNFGPHASSDRGGYFTLDQTRVAVALPGDFSLQNALAAALVTRAFGVPIQTIALALSKVTTIPGRAERVEAGQDFAVIVDYAHTPDSLEALYKAFPMRKVCVLGSTGGGRDTWKRPVMGSIADSYCDHVILTNEDPYDEDPRSIVVSLAEGMKRKPEIIMDRRDAIAKALSLARTGDAVLITGKGTDPNIAGPKGTKQPWSDAAVAKEEIAKLPARASV
jgi:UDP-N-acetylmuramoyl-L-alanyl-D-glutamate--2,6-diaminopimelate ligase